MEHFFRRVMHKNVHFGGKSFLKITKSNQIWIVITLFQLIMHKMEFRLVPNQSDLQVSLCVHCYYIVDYENFTPCSQRIRKLRVFVCSFGLSDNIRSSLIGRVCGVTLLGFCRFIFYESSVSLSVLTH